MCIFDYILVGIIVLVTLYLLLCMCALFRLLWIYEKSCSNSDPQ